MISSYRVHTEDDRTAAISAGSLADVALERAIRTRFRSLKRQEIDTIFAGTGPLATSSAKIQIAYALGIIGPQTKHDLTTIKDIRNVFAHAHQDITFRNLSIRRRCLGMHIVQRNRLNLPVTRSNPFDARVSYLDLANVFQFLFGLMAQSRKRLKAEKDMGDISY